MTHMPTNKELRQLTAFKRPHSLTMYIPYIEPNTPMDPNRIELKDMMREARTILAAAGVTEDHITKTIAPIQTLLERPGPVLARMEGMAIFSHPKLFRHFAIPNDKAAYSITVSDGFDIEPLQELVEEDQEFLLLTLSHKNVALFKGNNFELEPMELEGFPKDMKESLRIDEYPQSRETHPVAPASTGKGSEGFHQQYNVRQTDKMMLKEFFRRIDKRLHPYLTTNKLPLILAGVGYLLPIYRSVNTYKNLVPEGITGNMEQAPLKDMHRRASHLVLKLA